MLICGRFALIKSPPAKSGAGYQGGDAGTEIDKLTFSTEAWAATSSTLARAYNYSQGCNDNTYGWMGTGTSTDNTIIERMTLSTESMTDAIDTLGSGTTARSSNHQDGSTKTKSWWNYNTTMESFPFSTETLASVTASLTYASSYHSACFNTTYSWIGGGTTQNRHCDKFTQSSETVSLLSTTSWPNVHNTNRAAASDETGGQGWFFGTSTTAGDIDRVTFSSDTFADTGNNLSTNAQYGTVNQHDEAAYIIDAFSTAIRKFTFSTEACADLSATLSDAMPCAGDWMSGGWVG